MFHRSRTQSAADERIIGVLIMRASPIDAPQLCPGSLPPKPSGTTIKTTVPLHLKILSDADFNAGRFNTSFMERYMNTPAKLAAAG